MGVQQYEDLSKDVKKLFKLDTKNTSYVIAVVDDEQFLGHVYYGQKLNDYHLDHLLRIEEGPFVPSRNNRDRGSFLDSFPMEYPAHGLGDYREDCISIRTGEGNTGLSLNYVSHKIISGKPALEGLPASFGTEQECETLEITCRDSHTGLEAVLMYTVFEDVDVITRSVKVVNASEKTLFLTRVMSACLDMDNRDFEAVTLHGSWARERHIQTVPVSHAKLSVESVRGESSHQDHPFMALKTKGADDDHGEVYAMNFVYSGNFKAMVQNDQFDQLRMIMGIHPEDFSWKLNPGEAFQAPEVVMVYSAGGLGTMTRTFHDFYRNHLIRGEYKDKKRPILINNWEATYFDFTEDRLVEIAAKAKECGVELFVLDDGWFGARSNDYAGLGDWVANRERLPQGIKGIADRIEEMGMKFGLWFEPEMVNKDSDLYRAHPDWILQTPQRHSCHGRNQYVLDFSRKEVVDCIYEMMYKILSEAKVSYIKWDMNRSITECYSAALPADRQGEVFHRYILGVYDLYERLNTAFPQILFESCASGGGRFDPGILYYAPQGWTSDDTDAAERVKIQYGTSMCYPVSSMGSHVSVVPNHQLNRKTPLHTRANVAYFGTFGYELDLNKLSDEEISEVKQQITFMKEYRELIQFGTFYRLKSPFEGNETVWMTVSEDKKTALVFWYRERNVVNADFTRVRLQGLDPDLIYRNEYNETENYGDELMNLGLLTTDCTAGEPTSEDEPCTDYESRIYVLTAK